MKVVRLFVYVLLVIFATMTLALALISCRPTKPLQHTIHRTDTIIERERLVPIQIPSTEVNKTFSKAQVDSIIAALKNMPSSSRVIYYTDPKLKTQLSFALDSIGNLVFQCKTLEALYWEKLKEKDRIIERRELEVRQKEESIFKKIERVIIIASGALLLIIIIVVATFIYLYRKLKP